MAYTKVVKFTDLVAWQRGHEMVLEIYKLTKLFPKEEIFCLVNQMRRAIISVTSNIAEGFSRKSAKEKNQFYSMALGSLTEIQNQLIASRDIGYLSKNDFDLLFEKSITVHKLITGLVKSSNSRP